MDKEIFVIYCSPSGSTRRVAEVIGNQLDRENINFTDVSLDHTLDWNPVLNQIKNAGEKSFLMVGSPVYKDLAAAPVMNFIQSLPEVGHGVCIPFVTWGSVSSGIALWQMGRELTKKGYGIAAAAKVLSEHSALWWADSPPGKGHPDKTDEQTVADFVMKILLRLNLPAMPMLPLEALDYQPRNMASALKQKFGTPRDVFYKSVDEKKCIQCGICEENCPMDAIWLDPFPVVNDDCFDCLNCIRWCPEEAFRLDWPPLQDLMNHVEKQRKMSQEEPATRIFFPHP